MGWTGMDELIAHVEQAPARVDAAVAISLDEIADALLDEIRSVVPRKSGDFRRSWVKEAPVPSVRVVASRGLRYAPFVPYDHSGVKRILSQSDDIVEQRVDAALEF